VSKTVQYNFQHVLDVENFFKADDDLATSAVPTDNDIIYCSIIERIQ
jgi:hypothetical protein